MGYMSIWIGSTTVLSAGVVNGGKYALCTSFNIFILLTFLVGFVFFISLFRTVNSETFSSDTG